MVEQGGRRTATNQSVRYSLGELGSNTLDERMVNWLVQRSLDENIPIIEVIRLAIEREMVANPITSKASVRYDVIDYFAERYKLEEIRVTLEEERDKFKRRSW